MHVFNHYDGENNLMGYNMHDQSDLVIIAISPPKSFHPPSPLAHYSLYPDMCDTFVISTIYLNPFNLYPVGHGCNQV